MPNCPVCGKEVQSTTAYCPTCGTSLKQTSAVSAMQSSTYSPNPPNYAYPQQGYGMPTAPQSHSHRKYILAIIVVGLVALVVGGLVTSTFLIGPDVTDVTGTVTLQTLYVNTYHGIPNRILFISTVTGNLSAGVFPDNSYQVYLPILSAGNYAVSIQWTNVTAGAVSFNSCTANPSAFSSSNQNATQNFSC
ncbi:MAG TPA: zinc-ribbon domain-containing protein [Candidatus Angelobacter sp.]|nr:zinc-ribbon domain-containing protein [Candidatus Angelobacter sp.]